MQFWAIWAVIPIRKITDLRICSKRLFHSHLFSINCWFHIGDILRNQKKLFRYVLGGCTISLVSSPIIYSSTLEYIMLHSLQGFSPLWVFRWDMVPFGTLWGIWSVFSSVWVCNILVGCGFTLWTFLCKVHVK